MNIWKSENLFSEIPEDLIVEELMQIAVDEVSLYFNLLKFLTLFLSSVSSLSLS